MSQSPITLRCTTVLLSLLSLLSLFPFTYTLPTDVYLSLSLSTSPPNGLPKSNDRAILDENPCTEEGLFYDGPDCDRFLECTIAEYVFSNLDPELHFRKSNS